MREALAARSDDDFIVEKPVRQARRRKTAAKPAKSEPGWLATLLRAALRRPGIPLAALVLSGCGGYIAYNALVLQKVHHPAPLFRSVVTEMTAPPAPAPLPPHRAAQEAATDALTAPERLASQAQALVPPAAPSGVAPPTPVAPVPPRPAARSPIGDLIRNGGEAAQTPPARQAALPAPQRTTAADPIADMIRMGGPVPIPPANVGAAQPDDRVTAAQRALTKLGYGVKVDGLAGPGTRQAIEAFERDRRLTVTGELGPKTLRELSALSGIAIH